MTDKAPTIAGDGKRRWIYPRRLPGAIATKRKRVAYLLILIYLATPWITINGHPILRWDVRQSLVSAFGLVFRLHDIVNMMFVLIALALTLFLVSAVRGRIWCGWGCPQTVWLEWVVRPLEEWIEGSADHRASQDRMRKHDISYYARKAAKHAAFLAVASILAHVALAYFVPPDVLLGWVVDSPGQHPRGFALVCAVTGVIYLDFSWFREQFCAYLCPYARFQSVVMDAGTPVVTYLAKRGEPRGRRASGDCIDCGLCQRVCPTGIDIRNGLQLECIQCARCIDACNKVMTSLKRPPGLIANVSEDLSTSEQHKLQSLKQLRQPKALIYIFMIAAVVSILVFRVSSRANLDLQFTRSPGEPFTATSDGKFINRFMLRATNNTEIEIAVDLTASSALQCAGCQTPLKPLEYRVMQVLITIDSAQRSVEIRDSATQRSWTLPVLAP